MGSDEITQTIDNWFAAPRCNPENEQFEAEQARCEAQDAVDQARADRSWIDFRNELQGMPELLLDYLKPGDGKVDGRRYHLWRLLSRLGENSSHFAIADISPLRPLFDDAVVEAFSKAMIQYCRLLHTTLPSEVKPEERRTSSANDLLGITGVTLEAGNNPGWTAALNEEEAKLATRFATRELSGFPKWIDDLVAAHPAIVKDILWRYLEVDLEPTNAAEYPTHLQDVVGASDAVATLMVLLMLDWLKAPPGASDVSLDMSLRLIKRDPATLATAIPPAASRSLEPRSRGTRAAGYSTRW